VNLDDDPRALGVDAPGAAGTGRRPVWLFDLDNTLHDASRGVLGLIDAAMTDYIACELRIDAAQADVMRLDYWRRHGATVLGLERHHGVCPAHFLAQTHRLPGLEALIESNARDRAALRSLPGRKFVLTNAPSDYARRVLSALGLAGCFEAVISIERMHCFGRLRPKPDARMLRMVLARLGVRPDRCVLVEDTLAHQRSAHAIGLRTVWMQRYLWRNAQGPEVGARLRRKPVYVYARIRSLQKLRVHSP
jgi:putative hydrolase of the HAD superfamily